MTNRKRDQEQNVGAKKFAHKERESASPLSFLPKGGKGCKALNSKTLRFLRKREMLLRRRRYFPTPCCPREYLSLLRSLRRQAFHHLLRLPGNGCHGAHFCGSSLVFMISPFGFFYACLLRNPFHVGVFPAVPTRRGTALSRILVLLVSQGIIHHHTGVILSRQCKVGYSDFGVAFSINLKDICTSPCCINHSVGFHKEDGEMSVVLQKNGDFKSRLGGPGVGNFLL